MSQNPTTGLYRLKVGVPVLGACLLALAAYFLWGEPATTVDCPKHPYDQPTPHFDQGSTWGQYCIYARGGDVSEIVGNEGYGFPLPILLSDFVMPPGTRFTGKDVQDKLDQGDYLIVQARMPIEVQETIELRPDKHLQGGFYASPGTALRATERNIIDHVFVDGRVGIEVRMPEVALKEQP